MNLDDAENKLYNSEEITKPVKLLTLSEADKMNRYTFKPFDYDVRSDFSKGVSVGVGELADIPQEVVLFGKRARLALGGYFGDTPEEFENKKVNLITAERNLQEVKQNRILKNKVSPEASESLSFSIGSNIPTFASMLVGAGAAYRAVRAISTAEKAISVAGKVGLAENFLFEGAGEVSKKTPTISKTDERVKTGKARAGELDVDKITKEWAAKSTLDVPLYAAVSTYLEAKVGFGEQLNIWNTPIKLSGTTKNIVARALAKTGVTAASEGTTETLQSLSSTGINLIDGTITPKDLPEELQEAVMSGIVGGIMGTASGGSVSLKQARNAISMIRQQVEPVVGKENAQVVAESVFNDASTDLSNIVTRELELDSQLRNKHGNVWNSMLTAVTKEMEGKPRFMAMTEDERASYANTVAKHFADQVLAEANYRGTTLDAILSASDITYDKGIRLEKHINLFDALKNPEMIPPETKLKRESLLAFLKRNGGLKDYGGELKSRDAQKLYPGLVSNKGMNFDDAALMAWENGYFPSKMERPDINEFLEVVDESLRGNHRYNTEEERNFSDAIEDLREELDRLGIDYENMTAAEIEKAVDEIPELKSLEREAAFYEQYEPEIGLSEDEAERLAIETEGKEYPIIDEKDLPERYYQIAEENAKLDAENPAYDGETITINGKEKTVYNSNGDRIAQSEAALRNFYNWFGDSKVVDEQGRPLVVYHGTNAEFDTFKGTKILNSSEGVGFNFAVKKDIAEGFGKVMPVYLKLENPVYAYSNIDLVSDTYEDDFEIENQEAIRNAVYKVKENLEQKGYTFYNEVDSDMLDAYAERSQAQEVLDGLLDLGSYIQEDYDAETLYNDIRQAEIDAFGIDGYVTNNYGATGGKVYIAFESNQIKSTSNRGTYSESENIYYQSAFAGSRVDYDKPSLEAIGTGEGAQAHGWGLYYALNKDVAENYREKFTTQGFGKRVKSVKYNGKEIDDNATKTSLIGLKNTNKENAIDLIKRQIKYADDETRGKWEKLKDFIENVDESKIDVIYEKGQVHEVDIPENTYLLDEELTFRNQSEFVQNQLKKLVSEENLTDKFEIYQSEENPKYNILENSDGEEIYKTISKALGSDKSASQLLEKYGIKGITYDGRQDGRCFVIFNPEDVRVIQKFYHGFIQKTDLGTTYVAFTPNQIKSTQNRGTYSESENIYYQTDNKIYSVFDLKVGDNLKAFGKVEEIDNKERKIKIGGEWYSMFMIDSEAQRGGLTLGEQESTDIDEDIDNYEVKVAKGDRTAVEEQKSKNSEYNKLAKEYYGTTNKLSETGYILTDGSLLDFSGKKFGGSPNNRSIDHREIVDALDEYKAGMEEFINSGNIRYLPEGDKILLSNEPTPQQYKVIERIINNNGGNITVELMNDANKWGMNRNDFYGEYNDTTINKVKRDIKAFYTGEGVREITQYFQRGKNAKGYTNITPDAYIIKLLEDADESTLPHEFAHYWLTEMWNYTRTGRASENYMKRWNIIADYLGIKPEQTRLTRGQQEKFASSYEAYLTRGELPTPLIASAFDDYDKWLQRVYNDYNKINYQSSFGKRRVRLTDAAIKFFQSMTTGTLEAPALAPKDTGVEVPQTVSAEEVIEPTNEIVETPTTYDTTRVINITEGEKGVSKVFQREAMKHADRIVDELGVSYNKINLEEQAIKAAEWVQNNLEEARKVIDGAAAPEGIIDTAIFIAYENEMLRIGNNAEYQRALKIHSQVQTQRGQAIAAERISTDDVYNPAYWWKKLQKNKENEVARKLFKGDVKALNEAVETETKKLMQQIAGKPKEKQVEALTKLAEKLQKDYNLDRLYQMPEEINERTVKEFVKDVFGINPTLIEGSEVTNKAEQLQKLWENTKDKSGNPSVEAMRAKRELNDLINAKTPSNKLAIWTSIFGRGIMLTSVKSPLLNIISNIEAGFTEGITRRLMYGTTEKAVDKSVKEEFSKYAWEVYKASGDIVTTMNDYDDDMRIIGEQILHSQGEGLLRAASRKVEEVSFKYLMGAPDVYAKRLAFNDTADLLATKIAREEGAKDISKRATEIYKDAILIKPQTEQGKYVREQAQSQAHYTTFTNDSWAARFGLSARNWLNMVGRNKIRLGDLTMKFVKTPANVQMMGLEYGFGLLYTAYNVQEIIKNPQSETSKIAIKAAVRNGLGIALAALLYSMLDPDDYFSEFDTLNPKEKDRMRAMGAMPNSIKIGNRWVSLDYFGQLGIPLVGMLEARRNNGLRSYIQSGLTQAAKIPGIKETKQLIDNMSEYARYDLKPEKIAQMMAGTVLDQARAMTIPAIVNDIAKMTDDYERDTMGGIIDKVISSIPGLRQTLPERYGIQGLVRTEAGQSPIVGRALTLLAGSRVKIAQDDKLVREVEKLAGKAEQPSISDVTKYGDLRLLSPEKKVRVRKEFYKAYNAESKKIISTREYQKKSPEDKKKALNKVRSRVVKSLKEKYSNDIQREKRRR